MQIIGVDLHTRQQTVAMLNVETREMVEEEFAARARAASPGCTQSDPSQDDVAFELTRANDS